MPADAEAKKCTWQQKGCTNICRWLYPPKRHHRFCELDVPNYLGRDGQCNQFPKQRAKCFREARSRGNKTISKLVYVGRNHPSFSAPYRGVRDGYTAVRSRGITVLP